LAAVPRWLLDRRARIGHGSLIAVAFAAYLRATIGLTGAGGSSWDVRHLGREGSKPHSLLAIRLFKGVRRQGLEPEPAD
jgi:hypothetical protein